MNRRTLRVLCLLLWLSACHVAAGDPSPAARPGPVQDLEAFAQFIATQPSEAMFHARYPDVVLVKPGEVASKELRSDHSRYFAQLDAQGRIVGGRFQ